MLKDTIILLTYDLSTLTSSQRKEYIKYRKAIIRYGYVMYQKSIYVKYVRSSEPETEKNRIQALLPSNGNIKATIMPLSTFENTFNVLGKEFDLKKLTASVVTI